MPAPASVLALVKRFGEQIDAYKTGKYNETQVRVEYIDPFFKALGWDMHNEQGAAPAYQDVIHEDAIKIGFQTKAPDYCFRIGGTRKFFLEAKKPAVNIKDDIGPAFQVRRYAWSSKLALSIVTDFEEFAVYDCRIRPQKNDKPSVGRVFYCRFEEYEQKWDEIAGIFSKEAILKGSFDKYADSTKKRKGTAEVDDAFLEEIESWRESLAKNIALRNPKLSVRELNFSVQQTIDRIIFLRICEDRGIEPYGRLQGLLNGTNIYKRLTELFRNADDRYNSGLFHFKEDKERPAEPDGLTLSLKIDDDAIQGVLKNLYPPDSPYEFSVLPADILGQVYEQFLGKVIRLTDGHRAKVEEKPEVRKAGGVYYTPKYIVDYIVKNTVGKLVEGKEPKEVSKLRVLDPACGSGSFLIQAYQYLLDWHRDWYASHEPEKHTKGKNAVIFRSTAGEWRLTTKERKRILLNNIYGVDIDSQAVEVTKLSLLLKVLEGESPQSLTQNFEMFHERVLPDLQGNIKCGNSLIGSDFYDGQIGLSEEDIHRINAFDWSREFAEIMRSGGFSAIIGNPPYDVLEKDRGESSWPHMALTEYIASNNQYQNALGGKLNLFRFFIVRSLNLIRVNGQFGMIVPLSLLADISCANTRRFVFSNAKETRTDCFPQKDNANRRVFKDAKLSTVIITLEKQPHSSLDTSKIEMRVYPWNKFEDQAKKASLRFGDVKLLDPENTPIPLVTEEQWRVCKKLYNSSRAKHLGDVPGIEVRRGEINQTIYRKYISDDSSLSRLLKGVEIAQYRLNSELKQGEREWFDEHRFLRENEAKPIVSMRRIATQRITGVDERLRIVATIVEPPAYFADSTNSIHLADGSPYKLEYVLGLLNSILYQWRFKLTSTNNNVGTNELEAMPFPAVDFKATTDRQTFDQIVNAVNEVVELHSAFQKARLEQEKKVITRKISSVTENLNKLFYSLFGLDENDIHTIEEITH